MRKLLISLAWFAGAAAAATTGTLTEQSQVRARKIVDSAVAAIGGAEALRSIDVVRLNLQGEVFPRLQMTTPDPPYEPGQFHETLLLDLKRNRLLLEQQTSGAGFDGHLTADRAIQMIKEALPGKPIRYVALTHHHSDHIGGLRSFIAEGATVITTRANRGVVETMANAPQNDRLARAPRKPEFLFVEGGRRVLTDGEQTVELIDVGPNPHAREMLVAWLPKQRVVFQGDLFFVPNNDAPVGPPQTSTLDFARKLQEKGLAPQTIASVHGRTATIDEFRSQAANSASPA